MTYARIRAAIKQAAAAMGGQETGAAEAKS
jgi:hypothetical protein